MDAEDTFKPEVHAFFLAPFLDQAELTLGHKGLLAVLGDLGVEESALRDRSAWVSLRFCERLIRRLYDATEDPLLGTKAGRAAFSAKYMGPLRAVIRAFGDPDTAYVQMAKSLPRFNKVGEISVDSASPGKAVLTYRARPGSPPERDIAVCDGRRANMAALPTLFDLPPARVEHPRCLHDGSDVCEYVVSFESQRSKRMSRLALLAGVAGGFALGMEMGWLMATALGIIAAAGLWGLARQAELRGNLSTLAATIVEQQDALVLSTEINEQRFAELVEAKAQVEQKVTERTAQLETALAELRALDQAKTEFFANISHELRTPLTLILSPLDSLRDPSNSVVVDAMEQNARRLLRMINQLLDLAKVDAKKASLDAHSTNLAALIENVVSPYRHAADERSLELVVTEVPDATFQLDPTWIESAITNLIANALRFARSTIEVGVSDEGGDLVFTVHDDGPGLDEQSQETIFDRFAQAQGAVGGTGIGLAIVREAARLHGGRADVRCDHHGTLFSVRIPRVVTREAAETLPPVAGAVVGPVDRETTLRREGPFAGAPRVLIAEDHPELRRFVADVLAPRFEVVAVSNGAEALELARRSCPDAIVTDVMMPKMGGHELTRMLRADPATKDVPVLLVTARGEPQDVITGFDVGADDYIVKPFHGRELLARIDAQLRLRQMLHRLAHQERLASLGVLAASVAHQVRNPLTALVSGLPAVRAKISSSVDERTQEMLGVFVDCAKRIERITLDLLDLSRVDREEDGTVRPGQGLMSAVRLTCAQLPADVDVQTEVDEETEISGRAGDLNHVFLNLLDNASRAIDRRGKISIRGSASAKQYRISIEDSGPGIAPDVAARIFEPFVTFRDAGEGTGLGLAIVQDVVKAHGGTIRCGRSAKLGGAEFVVELPI